MNENWTTTERWAIWDGARLVEPPMELAAALAKKTDRAILVPERYLDGGIDPDRGAAIADDALARLAAERQATSAEPLTFGETVLVGENPLWWTYRKPCHEWQAADLIPGALSCSVDKLDGHLWSSDEQQAFWQVQGRA